MNGLGPEADPDGVVAPQVVVRWFAAAREAAGTAEQRVPVPTGASVAQLLEAVLAGHGPRLAEVVARCSFLLDGVHADPATPIGTARALDVLPPFAGG